MLTRTIESEKERDEKDRERRAQQLRQEKRLREEDREVQDLAGLKRTKRAA